jgi:hypothetical protein
MELPLNCQSCGKENIVDLEKLESRPLDKIVTAKGYTCVNCSRWEAVIFTTSSLEEAMRKLQTYPPSHSKYQFLFAKAFRKARGLRERGEYDASRKIQIQS